MRILLFPLLLSACAPVEAVDEPIPERGAGRCTEEGLDQYIGRIATTDLAEEMMRVSGADRLRWVAPGIIVTADYRTDRLTVTLDETNVITKISCG